LLFFGERHARRPSPNRQAYTADPVPPGRWQGQVRGGLNPELIEVVGLDETAGPQVHIGDPQPRGVGSHEGQ
jgi:hypothetical protein